MHSLEVRRLACHIYSLLHSLRKTSLLVCASHSSVARWVRNPEQKPYDSRNRRRTRCIVAEALRAAVLADPLLSLFQLRSKVLDATGVCVSRELLRVTLREIRVTRKKAHFYGTSPTLPQRTREFLQLRDAYLREGRPFYSVDEAGFGRFRGPVYGYAPRGTRVLLRKGCTREPNTSVIACISSMAVESLHTSKDPICSESFSKFLQDLPAPKGSVILLDNASIHKSQPVKEVASSKGYSLLFTPPYSPWFNPIEGVFSVVKRHYYKYGSISQAFEAVQESHCASFFRHSQKIENNIKDS